MDDRRGGPKGQACPARTRSGCLNCGHATELTRMLTCKITEKFRSNRTELNWTENGWESQTNEWTGKTQFSRNKQTNKQNSAGTKGDASGSGSRLASFFFYFFLFQFFTFFIGQTLRKNNKKSTASILCSIIAATALASVARILYANKRNQQIHANRIFWFGCLPVVPHTHHQPTPPTATPPFFFLVSLAPNKLAICCMLLLPRFLQFFLLHLTLVSVAPQLLFALAFSSGNNCSQGIAR